MIGPRDSQRSRVYRAECTVAWLRSPSPWTLADVQDYVAHVWQSEWFRTHYPLAASKRVAFRDGRGTGSAYAMTGRYQVTFNFPKWARVEWVVLHEIAHAAANGHEAKHNWAFCAAYLALVRRFIGVEAHDELKAAFRAGRVRFRPKRILHLSPEERARRAAHARRMIAATPNRSI